MVYYYAVAVVAILVLKAIFWSFYYYYRRQRTQRMVDAGLIRPAPSVPGAPTSVATVSNVQGNYNTAYWTGTSTQSYGPTAPPSYESLTKDTGKAGLPPSYQEAVR